MTDLDSMIVEGFHDQSPEPKVIDGSGRSHGLQFLVVGLIGLAVLGLFLFIRAVSGQEQPDASVAPATTAGTAVGPPSTEIVAVDVAGLEVVMLSLADLLDDGSGDFAEFVSPAAEPVVGVVEALTDRGGFGTGPRPEFLVDSSEVGLTFDDRSYVFEVERDGDGLVVGLFDERFGTIAVLPVTREVARSVSASWELFVGEAEFGFGSSLSESSVLMLSEFEASETGSVAGLSSEGSARLRAALQAGDSGFRFIGGQLDEFGSATLVDPVITGDGTVVGLLQVGERVVSPAVFVYEDGAWKFDLLAVLLAADESLPVAGS